MSTTSGTGLVSGIDYSSILTQMRQAGTTQITLVQRQESKIQLQRQSLQGINKALLDFKSRAETLSKSTSFLSMTASSSDNSILTASADNTATAGQYNIRVRQLAQANRIATQGIATSDNTSIASGTGQFKFRAGDSGGEITIDVSAGMTLNQLRDAINSASGTKVRASIINDGTATNPYRLVLTANDTGAENAIQITRNDTTLNLSSGSIEEAVARTGNRFNGTITSSGTYTGTTNKNIVMEITSGGAIGEAKYKVSYDGGLTWSANDAFTTSSGNVDVTGTAAEGVNVKFDPNASPVNFAVGDRFSVDAFTPQMQVAQNALIEVDGVQITRSSNTFADVIPGVTVTANKVDDEVQSIKVQNSNSSVQTSIKNFIEAYNTLVDTVAEETAYDKENDTRAALFGDSGVTGMMTQIRSIVTGTVAGLSNYGTLSSIGVTMDKSGHLQMDATKVSAALSKNIDAVQALFVESGASTSTDVKFTKSTEDTKIGKYTVQVTQAAEQATVMGGRVLEDSGLATDEHLTVTHGELAQTVTLKAGQKIDSVVATLNQMFVDKEMGLQASNEGGKLKITSTGYGSEEKISVISDKDATAAGQLGLGTTTQTDSGMDVAGLINGVAGKGNGQTLTASDGSDSKGMVLTITAKSPLTATINMTRGLALGATQRIEALTNSTTGLFATREASFTSRMEDYDEQIEKLGTRLDAEITRLQTQFNTLESKLSAMQSQGNFLISQLSSMISSS